MIRQSYMIFPYIFHDLPKKHSMLAMLAPFWMTPFSGRDTRLLAGWNEGAVAGWTSINQLVWCKPARASLMVTWPIPIFSDIWCMFLIFFNTYIVFFFFVFCCANVPKRDTGTPFVRKKPTTKLLARSEPTGAEARDGGWHDGTQQTSGEMEIFCFFFCWKRYEKMLEKIWKDTYS